MYEQPKQLTPLQRKIFTIGFNILLIVFCGVIPFFLMRDMNLRTLEKKLYEFNYACPSMQQESWKDVEARAPDYTLTTEGWIELWKFGDKYDIVTFPPLPATDIKKVFSASSEMLAEFRAADEYIKANGISRTEASRVLNQAFSSQAMDLVTLLKIQ